jgi:hypothetical protein
LSKTLAGQLVEVDAARVEQVGRDGKVEASVAEYDIADVRPLFGKGRA